VTRTIRKIPIAADCGAVGVRVEWSAISYRAARADLLRLVALLEEVLAIDDVDATVMVGAVARSGVADFLRDDSWREGIVPRHAVVRLHDVDPMDVDIATRAIDAWLETVARAPHAITPSDVAHVTVTAIESVATVKDIEIARLRAELLRAANAEPVDEVAVARVRKLVDPAVRASAIACVGIYVEDALTLIAHLTRGAPMGIVADRIVDDLKNALAHAGP
jgi:hypothetical protein